MKNKLFEPVNAQCKTYYLLVSTFILTVFLFVIFTSRLLANDRSDLEIGVPQAMESPTSECFGAVLSPDGEYFYTLREELLTQYRISPFSKVGSIKIDREEFENTRNENLCRVLLSNDKTKLIIVFSRKILLIDTITGKMLNKFEIEHRELKIRGAVVNGKELVLLLLDSEGNSFHLAIRDTNTLKLKRKFHDLGVSFGFFPDRYYWGISNIQDRIYLATRQSLLVLNSNTYGAELTVLCKHSCRQPKISKDYKKLYVWNVLSVIDHLIGRTTSYDERFVKDVMVFDQETRESRFEKKNDVSRVELDPVLTTRSQASRARDYFMLSPGRIARATLVNLNTNTLFGFYQYDSGEAILMEKQRGGEFKYIHLTPRARKYLMMKNSDGNVLPINDETFEQYYRKARTHQGQLNENKK